VELPRRVAAGGEAEQADDSVYVDEEDRLLGSERGHVR
jgi:hypothetical protein